jgi:hypothetical protein
MRIAPLIRRVLLAAVVVSSTTTGGLTPPVLAGPPSADCHTTDGKFDACPNGKQEWSDVSPLPFPASGSFLYVNQDPAHTVLYLMYDFPSRTTQLASGESVHVTFDTVSQDSGVPNLEKYDVDIFSSGPIQVREQGQVIAAGRIAGAGGFGASPNSATPHVLAELQVPLTPGAPTSYSSDPLFWDASVPPTPPDPCPTQPGKTFDDCVKGYASIAGTTFTLFGIGAGVAGGLCSLGTIGGCAPAEAGIIIGGGVSAAIGYLLDKYIAADPPDPNFMVIAQPSFKTIALPAGLTSAESSSLSALLDNYEHVIGFAQAGITSENRAAGASQAGNNFWFTQQQQAARSYGAQIGTLLNAEPGLLTNVRNAFNSAGLKGTFTSSDVSAFQSNWSPTAPSSEIKSQVALLMQDLTALGFTSDDEAAIRQAVMAADPAAVAAVGTGTFPAVWTDPSVTTAAAQLGPALLRNDANFSTPTGPAASRLTQSFAATIAGDYVASGVGLRGGVAPSFGPSPASGPITIKGIPSGARVLRAFLYWGMLDDGESPTLHVMNFDGHQVNGTLLGSGPDTCWGRQSSFSYRADVTPFVGGNGTYTLTNFATGGNILPDGASLVVVFQAAGLPSKTVMLADGNVSIPSGVGNSTFSFSGFSATAPVAATTTFMVGDGQAAQFGPVPVTFTGSNGTLSLPGLFSANNGPLWDTDTFNVSSAVKASTAPDSVSISTGGDCVLWTAQAFSVTTAPPTGPSIQTAAVVEANPSGDTAINVRGLSPADAPSLADRLTAIVQFRTIQDPSISGPSLANQLVQGLVDDKIVPASAAAALLSSVTQQLVKPTPSSHQPDCALTLTGSNSSGQKFIQVTVQGNGAGLSSITVTNLSNASASVGTYRSGITSFPTTVPTPDHPTTPVLVTATKLSPTVGAELALSVKDVAGNVTNCDPVLSELGKRQDTQVFRHIPQAEGKVTIENGDPGYRQVRVIVNARHFLAANLEPGQVRTLDVSSAMKPGDVNTIVVRGVGVPSSTADVLIWDGNGAVPTAASAVTNASSQHVRHLNKDRSSAMSRPTRTDDLVNWEGGQPAEVSPIEREQSSVGT